MYLDFGERIRFLRERGKLTQEELAESMEVQRNTVWRWENQKANPNKNAMLRLAEVLNTTVAYLSGETDNPERVQPAAPQEPEARKLALEMEQKIDSEGVAQKFGIGQKDGMLYFKNGEQEIKLTDTPENKELYWRVVSKMLDSVSVSVDNEGE